MNYNIFFIKMPIKKLKQNNLYKKFECKHNFQFKYIQIYYIIIYQVVMGEYFYGFF